MCGDFIYLGETRMIKLSVCISVHNTAELLPRCLESVLSQTYKNIEIIIVNNGSTDNSIEIMRDYENRYENIFVFEQADKGLAQGRQKGIDCATGEYIAFLDADDYICSEMYDKMVQIAENTGADIVECETKRNGKVLESPYEGLCNSREILKAYFNGIPILSMLWLRIFNRKLFEVPVFPDIYINNEDIFAFPCLLYKSSNIYFLKEPLHVYSTDNEQAEMNKIREKRYDDEKLFDIKWKAFHVIEFVKAYIGINNIENNFKEEYQRYISRNIVYFCTANYRRISAKKIINTLCDYFGMTEKELNMLYRSNINIPVFFDKLATYVGLRKAIHIYRFARRMKSER